VDVLMGPVLYFCGMSAGRCYLAALVVTTQHASPGDLRVEDGGQSSPEVLATHRDLVVWRYAFSVPTGQQEAGVAYHIGAQTWVIYPPPNDRLRLAFTACNGSEDDALALGDPRRNERWLHLAHEHAASPFHLLVQGGDQLYADPLWEAVPYLAEWSRQKWQARLQAPFPPDAAEVVADFYFNRYYRLWAQPELAPLVASIPSVMMWDDHDVFDG
jgi:phosphodiesterase/alkaline phosphatase D-like protein